jgi:hypothetical protein
MHDFSDTVQKFGSHICKENMKYLFAVFALASQSSVWAHSVDQGYKAIQILDGETVRIAAQAKEITCRLHIIKADVRPRTNLSLAAEQPQRNYA